MYIDMAWHGTLCIEIYAGKAQLTEGIFIVYICGARVNIYYVQNFVVKSIHKIIFSSLFSLLVVAGFAVAVVHNKIILVCTGRDAMHKHVQNPAYIAIMSYK